MRRTLSVCLSVRPSRYRSPKFFYFGCSLARRSKVNKGRISYGHLGRTDSCFSCRFLIVNNRVSNVALWQALIFRAKIRGICVFVAPFGPTDMKFGKRKLCRK